MFERIVIYSRLTGDKSICRTTKSRVDFNQSKVEIKGEKVEIKAIEEVVLLVKGKVVKQEVREDEKEVEKGEIEQIYIMEEVIYKQIKDAGDIEHIIDGKRDVSDIINRDDYKGKGTIVRIDVGGEC